MEDEIGEDTLRSKVVHFDSMHDQLKEQVARHLQLPQRLAVRMIDAHGVPLVRSG